MREALPCDVESQQQLKELRKSWDCVQSCSALILGAHRAAAHLVVPALERYAPLPPSTQVAGGNSSHVYLIPEFIVTWFVTMLRWLAIWLTVVPGSKFSVHHILSLLKGFCDRGSGQGWFLFHEPSGHTVLRRFSFRPVLKS